MYSQNAREARKSLRTGHNFIIEEHPKETQLGGAPFILRLGRAPEDNKKASAAPRAASHLLSILFPLSRGKQEEKEISGRKIKTAGENVNAYRPHIFYV